VERAVDTDSTLSLEVSSVIPARCENSAVRVLWESRGENDGFGEVCLRALSQQLCGGQ